MFFDLRQQLFHAGHVAADSSVEFDRKLTRDGQLHVFHHLSVAEFDRKNLFGMRRGGLQLHCGEGPKRNGTEQSDFDSPLARFIYGGAQDARDDAVSHHDQFGVVGAVFFTPGFALFRPDIFRLHAALVGFQIIWLEID
jgi:hypothetical protein